MTDFDVRTPNLRRYADVAPLIGDAWLAQFRGASWQSRVIQYATGGVHSHSAMLARSNCRGVDVMEMVEFKGGRRVPLESRVKEVPGRIDVFSPDLEKWPTFDSKGAVWAMRQMTGMPYGWLGVSRIALRKIPLLWRLWPLDTSDIESIDTIGAPFCSHAVVAALREGGGVDPVPRKPDDLVSPNDLTWSLFFHYEFTLVP